jgi:hypothetical protein
VRNNGCEESCAQNRKWITSVAAIVAPQTCTLVRGALVFSAPARPVDLVCLSLTLSAASFPISLRLIGFDVLDVGLRPNTNSHLA